MGTQNFIKMYTNVSYQKLDGVSHRRLFTHVSTLNLQKAKTHLPTPKQPSFIPRDSKRVIFFSFTRSRFVF